MNSIIVLTIVIATLVGFASGAIMAKRRQPAQEINTARPDTELETAREASIKRRTATQMATRLDNLVEYLEAFNTAARHHLGSEALQLTVNDLLVSGTVRNTVTSYRNELKFMVKFLEGMLVVQLTDASKYESLDEPGARYIFNLDHSLDHLLSAQIQEITARAIRSEGSEEI